MSSGQRGRGQLFVDQARFHANVPVDNGQQHCRVSMADRSGLLGTDAFPGLLGSAGCSSTVSASGVHGERLLREQQAHKPGMVAVPFIPVTRRLRQEDGKLEAGLAT